MAAYSEAGQDCMVITGLTPDDPDTSVRPWTARQRLMQTGDHPYEFACHEDNEGIMQTILTTSGPT